MAKQTLLAVLCIAVFVSCISGESTGTDDTDNEGGGETLDEGGFEGDWVEIEFTGQFPDGVTIEREGNHFVWIDDDGSFLARIDENGDLIIDLGLGEATAVLLDDEMVARFLGAEAHFRRQTAEDIATAAASEVPPACAIVDKTALVESFGDDRYLDPNDLGSGCVFHGGLANVFTVQVEASSLAEWQARWADACDVHKAGSFENGVLCNQALVANPNSYNWTGVYWDQGMTVTVETRWPKGLSLGTFETILGTINLDGISNEDGASEASSRAEEPESTTTSTTPQAQTVSGECSTETRKEPVESNESYLADLSVQTPDGVAANLRMLQSDRRTGPVVDLELTYRLDPFEAKGLVDGFTNSDGLNSIIVSLPNSDVSGEILWDEVRVEALQAVNIARGEYTWGDICTQAVIDEVVEAAEAMRLSVGLVTRDYLALAAEEVLNLLVGGEIQEAVPPRGEAFSTSNDNVTLEAIGWGYHNREPTARVRVTIPFRFQGEGEAQVGVYTVYQYEGIREVTTSAQFEPVAMSISSESASTTADEQPETEFDSDVRAIIELWDGYNAAWIEGTDAGREYLAAHDSYGCSADDYDWPVTDQFRDQIVVDPDSIQRDDAWYTAPDRVYVMDTIRNFSGEGPEFAGQEGEGRAHVAFWTDGSINFFFGCQ